MPRLYRVEIALEYAVLADSREEAESYANDALRDTHASDHVTARLMRDSKGRYLYPDGWDDHSLVYGSDTDVPLKEAVEADRAGTREREEEDGA